MIKILFKTIKYHFCFDFFFLLNYNNHCTGCVVLLWRYNNKDRSECYFRFLINSGKQQTINFILNRTILWYMYSIIMFHLSRSIVLIENLEPILKRKSLPRLRIFTVMIKLRNLHDCYENLFLFLASGKYYLLT